MSDVVQHPWYTHTGKLLSAFEADTGYKLPVSESMPVSGQFQRYASFRPALTHQHSKTHQHIHQHGHSSTHTLVPDTPAALRHQHSSSLALWPAPQISTIRALQYCWATTCGESQSLQMCLSDVLSDVIWMGNVFLSLLYHTLDPKVHIHVHIPALALPVA
ncbi:hypothetical protein BYT27DRAFT_7262612 [Phlegmacium glaucopus]|nr:hypothetical protein BYT27DRAFT_7262612 [Phlegmacium glaucopus]